MKVSIWRFSGCSFNLITLKRSNFLMNKELRLEKMENGTRLEKRESDGLEKYEGTDFDGTGSNYIYEI